MEILQQLKVALLLSLCVLTAARNIHKLEQEALDETIQNTEVVEMSAALAQEPALTMPRRLEEPVATVERRIELDDASPLNALAVETLETPSLSRSVAFEDTAIQSEGLAEIVNQPSEKVSTKQCGIDEIVPIFDEEEATGDSESTFRALDSASKILAEEGNNEISNTEQTLAANEDIKAESLLSFTTFPPTKFPLLAVANEAAIEREQSENLLETATYLPTTEEIQLSDIQNEEHYLLDGFKADPIPLEEIKVHANTFKDGEQNRSKNLAIEATAALTTEANAISTHLQQHEGATPFLAPLLPTSRLDAVVAPQPPTESASKPEKTFPTGQNERLGLSRGADIARPELYPVWLPNYTTPLGSSIILNPFNATISANNAIQNTFGLGIFPVLRHLKPNWTDSLPLSKAKQSSLPSTASKDASEHATKIEQTSLQGSPHVLHLFFPVKYVQPAPPQSEAAETERKIETDGADLSANELLDSNENLKFELELPQHLAKIVKGALDNFKPFVRT